MASDNSNTGSVVDTDHQHLGRVYAQALIAAASKAGKVEAVVGELGSLVEVLGKLPRLKAILESPRIGAEEKNRLVDKAFGGKASPELVRFVKVVSSRGRANCLAAIYQAARAQFDEQAQRLQALMTTAQPVDDNVRQRVADQMKKLLGKSVVVNASVDPDILGGLIVRVGDTVYDGSLRNQLNQIKVAATGRANQEIRKSLDRFVPGA